MINDCVFFLHPTAVFRLHIVQLGNRFLLVRSLAYADCNSYTKTDRKNAMYVIYVLLFDVDNVMGKRQRSNERTHAMERWSDGTTDDDSKKWCGVTRKHNHRLIVAHFNRTTVFPSESIEKCKYDFSFSTSLNSSSSSSSRTVILIIFSFQLHFTHIEVINHFDVYVASTLKPISRILFALCMRRSHFPHANKWHKRESLIAIHLITPFRPMSAHVQKRCGYFVN